MTLVGSSRHDVRAQSEVAMRRAELLSWMREGGDRAHLTAREIADGSGIYFGHGAADRCFDDLKALASKGAVWRRSGRPARWNPS